MLTPNTAMFVSGDVEWTAYHEIKSYLLNIIYWVLIVPMLSSSFILVYLILREEQRFFLQDRKLDFKEIKQLAYNHIANKIMS